MKIPLSRIAHGRSGDKGDTATSASSLTKSATTRCLSAKSLPSG